MKTKARNVLMVFAVIAIVALASTMLKGCESHENACSKQCREAGYDRWIYDAWLDECTCEGSSA